MVDPEKAVVRREGNSTWLEEPEPAGYHVEVDGKKYICSAIVPVGAWLSLVDGCQDRDVYIPPRHTLKVMPLNDEELRDLIHTSNDYER